MLLTDISKYIKCNDVYNISKKKITINGFFTNSKNVEKNSIFVIKDYKKIKPIFIKEAIYKGALAIISLKYLKNIKITQFIVSDIESSLSLILNKLNPIKPLNSISVTGTNGKTSVVWYIAQLCLLNKIPTKTYGTLGFYINNKKKKISQLTTPEFEILHQTAFKKKKNLYNYIFEASSHSLDQGRLRNFPINIAAITNITHDHLDYHKNFSSYKEAKLKLFTKYLDSDGIAIINDNISGISNLKKKFSKNQLITYGSELSDIYIYSEKSKLILRLYKKKYSLKEAQYSRIQLENISCAIACCLCLDIKISKLLKMLKYIKSPPGRIEKVKTKNINYNVYVDYAHTPDALKKVLMSLTLYNSKPDLVFGCGGNRDKDKRIKMGVIASKYANKVYITDDNPRNESPSKIRDTILLGCKKAIVISDRKKAIFQAINNLEKKKVLIIAGKGNEKFQIYKNKIKLFDDLKIANTFVKRKIWIKKI